MVLLAHRAGARCSLLAHVNVVVSEASAVQVDLLRAAQMLLFLLPLGTFPVAASRIVLHNLISLLCLNLLLLLGSEFLQEADVIVGARTMLCHQRGRVLLNGGCVLGRVLMMLASSLVEHRCVMAQLTRSMLNFSRVTLTANRVVLAAVQLLVSLHDLIRLKLQLELLESHVVLRVMNSRVTYAVILISLQDLLLEAVVHLLHNFFAAFTSLNGLVSH